MERITAMRSIANNMVKDGDVPSFAERYRLNKPSVHKTVCINSPMMVGGVSIAFFTERSLPQPTTSSFIERKFGDKLMNTART